MSKQLKKTFFVYDELGKRTFSLKGKTSFILGQLVLAGPKGITTLELKHYTTRLANRISEYRNDYSLDIETLMEANTGSFGGTHGRYVLKTVVEVLPLENLPEAA